MRDNSGSLFKNERREKDTHAHARGTAMIDGVEYYVDAWTNTASNGNKYQSLKFKRKEQRSEQSSGYRAPEPTADDLDEEIPF
jgi:hypothetical protein